jgi:hypothetical protein
VCRASRNKLFGICGRALSASFSLCSDHVRGIIRWILEKRTNDKHLEEKRENGVLYSSGLIAGAALTGVCIMVLVGLSDKAPGLLESINRPGIHVETSALSLVEADGEAITDAYRKVSITSFPETDKLRKLL